MFYFGIFICCATLRLWGNYNDLNQPAVDDADGVDSVQLGMVLLLFSTATHDGPISSSINIYQWSFSSCPMYYSGPISPAISIYYYSGPISPISTY